MKKLLAAILAALLIAAPACADDRDMLDEVFMWSTKPNSYLHMYISCPILSGETEYELVIGTPSQAAASGKDVVCRLCYIRAAKAMGVDPAVASHALMQGLNDDDLRYFHQLAQLEMLSRTSEPVTLPAGIYVVGQDIPEGEWRFDIVSYAAELAVYKDNQAYTAEFAIPYFDIILGMYTNEYTVGRLYLSEGNIVYTDGALSMRPYTGVMDLQ